ncbi:zinc finger CCCH domain-containing protein 5-like [Durio zibethinus]|uniref:Zinc finger CCCH domain-containing protein 5-like n=1 Tax=Durio zibethinus TaxID=66656 RepID=A0A6P5WEZ6_DURZI|nr:zinc finger CCCH domain-containing protein 5-like [Durio zibethinus]
MEKSRKEKRKEIKKMKRKQLRKEAVEKEWEAEEDRLNGHEEQRRIEREEEEEEEERKRRELALKEFEERERAWIHAMEIKRKALEDEEEVEKKRNHLKEDANREQEEMGDDWEYVEEGPAEIIWQGNEIFVRKKKVMVPKGEANEKSKEEDADRPTSNPLPPQSEAFADYLNASLAQ